eukprot:TRINITY_DN9933_c0_g1_i1.p1 TRINITY_DN9933_c0_g1~~TRINITY_DN9933_c0_g1_i1.p1  ORF type:complete len:442 (+),score=100.06 TRINITY_DN9933_c0_g1_i1:49-1374(+)
MAEEGLQELYEKAKLAHDAVFVTKDPSQLGTPKEEDDSIAGQFKKVAEQAFWDILELELDTKPPVLRTLRTVLEGLKDQLIDVTPRKMRSDLEKEFSEKIDFDLLLADNLDYELLVRLFEYFIKKILELEAPADNEETNQTLRNFKLRNTQGESLKDVIVPPLRYLRDKLSKLKEAIHEARLVLAAPLLAKDAEKHLNAFYAEEVRQGKHNFERTKEILTMLLNEGSEGKELNKTVKLYSDLPRKALLWCVFHPEVLDGKLPELMLLDAHEILKCADVSENIILSTAIGGVVAQVSQNASDIPKVAEKVSQVLANSPQTGHGRVVSRTELIDEILSCFTDINVDLVTGMLEKVISPDDSVYKLYTKRLETLLTTLVIEGPEGVPPVSSTPFAHVSGLVKELVMKVSKMVTLHLKWFRGFYTPILTELVDEINSKNTADATQ